MKLFKVREPEPVDMSFFEHLDALRPRLMRSAAAFGYFLLAPLSINFLANYTVSGDISNMIDIGSYMSIVLNMTFVCGFVFLLPVLVGLLAGMGLLTASFMKRYRRHAIVILAAVSAIITPPDAASMVLVALPLYGLYELSISIAARGERRHRRELEGR